MQKKNPELKVEKRNLLGRGVKHLRNEGILPATVYGKGFEPLSIQVNAKEIEKLFDEVGESGLVELLVEKDKLPILFKNPQYNPIDGSLLHIDCHKVNLKEKITAAVPLELIGESDAVKGGNVLVQITNEVDAEALPADLPEKIEVDISVLKGLEDVITIADLKVDKDKVEIQNPADQVVVKIEEPAQEEEIAEPEVAPGEVPATEQKTEEEKEAQKEE